MGLQNDIRYGPADANTLDICSPRDGTARMPGVLLIHGGGWAKGDKGDMRDRCLRLARKGLVAVSVNYRLADLSDPGTFWPAQLSDVQLAMRWMRAHARQLGINPAKICAVGDSAGGQLAVFLGVTDAVVKDGNAGLYAGYSSAASCVVDNSGMVDLTDSNAMSPFTALLGGATPKSNPQAYAAASPLQLVSAHSAPMLVVHGYTDKVVPMNQAMRLVESLVSHGVPAEFIGYPGGHQPGMEAERIYNLEMRYLLTH
jgi:acetyl esterase/lipase